MRKLFSRGYVFCFPGTGKTHIYKNASEYGLVQNVNFKRDGVPVYDNDTSTFDKSKFPENLIADAINIAKNHSEFLYLSSTYDSVRVSFKESGLKYDLVFPKRELKDEYIQRYKDRGSSEIFIEFMEKNWDIFIDSLESDQTIGIKYRLESGQYVSDVLL